MLIINAERSRILPKFTEWEKAVAKIGIYAAAVTKVTSVTREKQRADKALNSNILIFSW